MLTQPGPKPVTSRLRATTLSYPGRQVTNERKIKSKTEMKHNTLSIKMTSL